MASYSAALNIPVMNITIVGVVGNAVQNSFEQEVLIEMFHPYINPYNVISDSSAVFVVRGRPEPLASIRQVIANADPGVAISNIATMDEIAGRSLASRRLSLGLFAAFAGAATLMAAIGLYGTLTYAASQRVREIGVRMSLGARRMDLFLMFLREAGVLTTLGILIGTVSALAAGSWMSAMLFEIPQWDLQSFTSAIVLVTAVALGSSLIPAIRASRTDPVDSLR
jgi:ABC-type antimicrobial peptide transport system permease subunit